MKRIISSFLFFICFVCANAQISFISAPQCTPKREVEMYDSLTNINPLNFKFLVGQQVQPLPKEYLQKRGYYFGLNLYYSMPQKIYRDYSSLFSPVKDDTGRQHTFYSELAGHVFNVVGIDSVAFFNKNVYFLKVNKVNTTDTLYLSLGEVNDYMGMKAPEFILSQDELMVVGYFEKIKKNMIGKKYVLHNSKNIKYSSPDNPAIFDISGKAVGNLSYEMPITITDVSYYSSGEKPQICYILSSDTFQNAIILSEDLKYTLYEYELYEADKKKAKEWQASIYAKYPKSIANDILDHIIRVGFTESMVIDAWGETDRINTYVNFHGKREQWVYDDGSYVYFSGGKVSSINY